MIRNYFLIASLIFSCLPLHATQQEKTKEKKSQVPQATHTVEKTKNNSKELISTIGAVFLLFGFLIILLHYADNTSNSNKEESNPEKENNDTSADDSVKEKSSTETPTS